MRQEVHLRTTKTARSIKPSRIIMEHTKTTENQPLARAPKSTNSSGISNGDV
jgi:hypothetical protein